MSYTSCNDSLGLLCHVLSQDISKLLVEWKRHLSEAAAVFVRVPVYRRSSFFSALLERGVHASEART